MAHIPAKHDQTIIRTPIEANLRILKSFGYPNTRRAVSYPPRFFAMLREWGCMAKGVIQQHTTLKRRTRKPLSIRQIDIVYEQTKGCPRQGKTLLMRKI